MNKSNDTSPALDAKVENVPVLQNESHPESMAQKGGGQKGWKGIPLSRRVPVVAKNGRTIMAPRKRTRGEAIEDFRKMFVVAPNGCWEWKGQRSKPWGYGRFKLDGKKQSAHRLSYEFFVGPVPRDLFVCHNCDNPPCVNPDHLFLGTSQENTDDMMKKGRHRSLCGTQNPSAKLNDDIVREIRKLYGTMMVKEIAARFGIQGPQVTMIAQRKRWAHVQ